MLCKLINEAVPMQSLVAVSAFSLSCRKISGGETFRPLNQRGGGVTHDVPCSAICAMNLCKKVDEIKGSSIGSESLLWGKLKRGSFGRRQENIVLRKKSHAF